MPTWFSCKIAYFGTDAEGAPRKLTENYIIDGVSYGEAEIRLAESLPSTLRNFEIKTINKTNLSEIIPYDENGEWFKIKITIWIPDEEGGKEKKTSQYFLVRSANIQEAYSNVYDTLNSSVHHFKISKIEETTIKDVIHYGNSEQEG